MCTCPTRAGKPRTLRPHSVCTWCEQAREAPGCGCRRMWRCPSAHICAPCGPTCPAAHLRCCAGPCRPASICPQYQAQRHATLHSQYQTQTRNPTAWDFSCKRTNSRRSCSAGCRGKVSYKDSMLKNHGPPPLLLLISQMHSAQCQRAQPAHKDAGKRLLIKIVPVYS